MSSDEAELDAVVDSILLRGLRPSASSSSGSPAPAGTGGVLPSTQSQRAPGATDLHAATSQAERVSVDTSIWRAPHAAGASAVAQLPAAHYSLTHSSKRKEGDKASEHVDDDEEDLNALVERILAGPSSTGTSIDNIPSHALSSGSQSSRSSHPPSNAPDHQHQQEQHRHQQYDPAKNLARGVHAPVTQTRSGPQSPNVPSPSISPASSSPRYQLPQTYTQQQQQLMQPAHAAQQLERQQQQHRPSMSGSSGAASRRAGGATRVDASFSRASMSAGLHNTSTSGMAATARTTSPMEAVVRRLALWQERREAKRVQSVYEALEKEQEECTFEPSINRLGSGEGGSRSVSRSHPSAHNTRAEGQEEGEEGGGVERFENEESDGRPARASADLRTALQSQAVQNAQTPLSYSTHKVYNSSNNNNTSTNYYHYSSQRGTSAASSSCAAGGEATVPSLLPPPQPIYGVDAFIDRLRRAQEERDAVKAAEEAKRLRYYDPTTFKRDLTVPEPFEFGDTRPRRVVSSTVAVAGVPSPLARLRALSMGANNNNSVDWCGTANPVPLTSSPSRVTLAPSAGASNAVLTRSPYSHTLGPGSPLENEAGTYEGEEGEDGFADGGEAYGMGDGGDAEGERLTAENTFLSLAPQIRESLLFDRAMEQQLHRATESIRRGIS